jgi:peptidoglycan biosynthesis protein MviN/MurJ (putative lipid II flippase)
MEQMNEPAAKLSLGGLAIIIALVAILVAAAVYAILSWNNVGTPMTGWGWTMLVLGVVISIALGVGLMFLVFYSARHDMDQ